MRNDAVGGAFFLSHIFYFFQSQGMDSQGTVMDVLS